VTRADPFVSKDSTELKDALESSHHESFQPELGPRCASRNRCRGRDDALTKGRAGAPVGIGLSIGVSTSIKPGRPTTLSNRANHLAASLQRSARRFVRPEVALAKAVAQSKSRDAAPLVAKVVQGFRESFPRRHLHRQLTSLGARTTSPDAPTQSPGAAWRTPRNSPPHRRARRVVSRHSESRIVQKTSLPWRRNKHEPTGHAHALTRLFSVAEVRVRALQSTGVRVVGELVRRGHGLSFE